MLFLPTFLPILLSLSVAAAAASPPPPKCVVSILLDDFGYSSASFNQEEPVWETSTPHLDSLAAEGVILRSHYTHPFCSPTRSSFLSGRLPVHVQVSNVQPDLPNAGIPKSMQTLPQKICGEGKPAVCHMVGKYDVGAATFAHTPEGRGFNTSLIYFSHAVDYFTQNSYSGSSAPADEVCGDALVDFWDSGAPAKALNGTGYVDDILLARALSIIAAHDFTSGKVLYLHYTPHVTHDPLQVTPAALARLGNTTDDEGLCQESLALSATGAVYPGAQGLPVHCRRIYEAAVSIADAAVGAIRGALAARGVWEESFLVLTSDNGGQGNMEYGGGSNAPLRGGKGSEFEGGIRTAALVAGGALPVGARGGGRVENGLIHTADWLVTLCVLVGAGDAEACASDPTAAAAGLPPMDSLDVWPLLAGINTTSPRTEIPVSPTALVTTRYKLLLGANQHGAGWQGPGLWPNASSPQLDPTKPVLDCSHGCLFDRLGDVGEHQDISESHPDVVLQLKARLGELVQGFYSNNESAVCKDSRYSILHECACAAGRDTWGGFFGPYAE